MADILDQPIAPRSVNLSGLVPLGLLAAAVMWLRASGRFGMRRNPDELIFGFTWDEIKAAQRKGGRLPRLQASGPIVRPEATDKDRALLAQHGETWLLENQMHGVLDRLRTSGLI